VVAEPAIGTAHAAAQIDGHGQRHLRHRLGEHRADVEHPDAVAEAVAVVDVRQEVAFDVEHHPQGRQLCQALGRQLELADDDGRPCRLFGEYGIGDRAVLVDDQFAQGAQALQVPGIEDVADGPGRRGHENPDRVRDG